MKNEIYFPDDIWTLIKDFLPTWKDYHSKKYNKSINLFLNIKDPIVLSYPKIKSSKNSLILTTLTLKKIYRYCKDKEYIEEISLYMTYHDYYLICMDMNGRVSGWYDLFSD